MNGKKWIVLGVVLAGLALLAAATVWAGPLSGPSAPQSSAAALSTGFTYQGRLKSGGMPIGGDCELAFRLYDQAADGTAIGSPITVSGTVSDGLVTVDLDFGPDAFAGDARWLDVRVKCTGDADLVTLERQALQAAPYALQAGSAGALQGYAVTTTAPAANQALTWDGSAWTPIDGITGIYAGSGLSGGGESGAVTLDLALPVPSASLALAAPWSGLTGVPGGFADGVDADTTYSAGTGLTLVDSALTLDTSTVQRWVSGSCPPGGAIRAVGADGSVVCWVDAPHNRSLAPTANVITTLDASDSFGQYTSVAIGIDGLGLISYRDYTHTGLGVAHCEDIACTSATYTVVDGGGGDDVGWYTSVAIGADGLPLISYYHQTKGRLMVAHCEDIACTGAITTTLDSDYVSGQHTSIAIGADGLGLIAYRKSGIGTGLRVAHCENLACTDAITSTIDNAFGAAQYISLVIGVDGLGLISYRDEENDRLKVAHCDNLACTSATLTPLDETGDVGKYTSLAIGVDGLGLISYHDAGPNLDLKVAHCEDIACTSATSSTLDGPTSVGYDTALTIGTDGLGLISYREADPSYGLKVAHCDDVACTSATALTLDTGAGYNVGHFSSVAIGADGLPLISYHNQTGTTVKVAHCGSPFCAPYFRRR